MIRIRYRFRDFLNREGSNLHLERIGVPGEKTVQKSLFSLLTLSVKVARKIISVFGYFGFIDFFIWGGYTSSL